MLAHPDLRVLFLVRFHGSDVDAFDNLRYTEVLRGLVCCPGVRVLLSICGNFN